ncbi:MAG: hypothetical protein J7J82_01955 [Staphylothermus sp.]|nr:hypothetical protein [Staphylothermus sp.]
MEKRLEGKWWTGRDLNPGPPGCKPTPMDSPRRKKRVRGLSVNYTPQKCFEITDMVIQDFLEWVKRDNPTIKPKTIKQYEYYIPKLQGLALCSKRDVDKVFKIIKLNKSSYEAFSRFLTYIEKRHDGYEDLVVKLRKALPRKPKAREDTYIPPDTKVVELDKCLEKHGEIYAAIYKILVFTGCRGTEARYILEHIHELKTVKLDYGAVRIHLPPELQRGSKNEFVVYLPVDIYNELLKINTKNLPHQDTIEDKFRDCGLALKYLRKWFRQKLKLLGIDSETIEAFQGRVKTIGGKHYTDWIPILDSEYEKILKELRKLLVFG